MVKARPAHTECAEGEIELVIEFYDGQTAEVGITRNGDKISAGSAAAVPFIDVKAGTWYQEAVS